MFRRNSSTVTLVPNSVCVVSNVPPRNVHLLCRVRSRDATLTRTTNQLVNSLVWPGHPVSVSDPGRDSYCLSGTLQHPPPFCPVLILFSLGRQHPTFLPTSHTLSLCSVCLSVKTLQMFTSPGLGLRRFKCIKTFWGT